MTNAQQQQAVLIEALQRPETWPHPVEEVVHIETHISHVLLAGEYAYKIKKPLDLGFLDFSTLEKRRFFCEEELRINRRLAPELYEGLVTIAGEAGAPVIEGSGEPLEYAVRMKRFDREQELDKLLERNELAVECMDELAERAARFHNEIPRASEGSGFGTPEAVLAPMEENFDQLAPLLDDDDRLAQLERLRGWTRKRYESLRSVLEARHRDGFIRECHGDMHLGNMARIGGELVIFDGIEFSEALRWVDIISEVAFVTMDLHDRNAPAHARRFLNAWLEQTGDYAGLVLLRFYEVYRAMVRAKVAGIRLSQTKDPQECEHTRALCHEYLDLAERRTAETGAALLINHGLSGSGKTTRSQVLVEELGMVRIRSDVERKRLAGMSATDRADEEIGGGLYASDMSDRTYRRLEELCEQVLQAGHPVIADATFLEATYRERFAQLAGRLQVPFSILDYRAPEDVLRERVKRRAERDNDASDAGLSVLEHQLQNAELLKGNEPVIPVEHDSPLPLETISGLLRQTDASPAGP